MSRFCSSISWSMLARLSAISVRFTLARSRYSALLASAAS
jgi:hypothetical protein